MKYHLLTRIVLLASIFTLPIAAVPIPISESNHRVEFLAVGQPSAIQIRGKLEDGAALKAKLEIIDGKLSGQASIPLEQFSTGIEMRDKHIREKYLETTKFPQSTLRLQNVAVGSPEGDESPFNYQGRFEGVLSLHGNEKPVKGDLTLAKKEQKWNGELQFEIELSDFGITIPTYLGITVSKRVKISVEFNS